jgi:hypothetical protein
MASAPRPRARAKNLVLLGYLLHSSIWPTWHVGLQLFLSWRSASAVSWKSICAMAIPRLALSSIDADPSAFVRAMTETV